MKISLTTVLSLALLAVGASAYLREGDETLDFPKPKEFEFGEEKGARCKGSMKGDKGHMECEAGMRKNFTASFAAEEMVTNVAATLQEQFMEVLPKQDFFLPSEDMMAQMQLLEADPLCDDEVGCEMSFGGSAKMEFGCKMTFKFCKKCKKAHKVVECGIKGFSDGSKKSGNSTPGFKFVMPKMLD
mmetsp:Transcript_299/g.620  ORF Transcript_299/g.620 Transcript_299/m.620 type:complete len:186 (-) Transcript_299:74-631(-)|eukprot:CAMPEP_0168732440 /NCGR_PEP_ID=MMETSP0724-20121128/7772_1 /TAXON_ID=265536 /ORGANISM="Amphiprora sp., Strain CCMP467" /LENGTH=185 /DNA_ID=CAMNT_0008779459 /DNA_START=83 /DNA_END=640 /DNA_ORIENTATION=+